jgi:Nif-specific regulatory protein
MPRPADAMVLPREGHRDATPPSTSELDVPSKDEPGFPQMDTPEYDTLLAAMEKSGWVQAKVVRLLGMTPRQVGYAVRKLSIPMQKF